MPPAPDIEVIDPQVLDLTSNLITRMAASVHVNGKGPFAFVIDTGAGRSSIADSLAGLLQLKPGPTVMVHGITSAALTPTVGISHLGLGDQRFRDIDAPVFPRERLGADGLLGLDVLSAFRLTIDIAHRAVRMAPSGSHVIPSSITFTTPSRLRRDARSARRDRFGQLLLVNVLVEGLPVEAFIDSGSQYSIGNEALLRALSVRPLGGTAERFRTVLRGVTGQELHGQLAVLNNLSIARRQLGATPVVFADLHAFRTLDLIERPALLIGADVLGRFGDITLDFARASVSFGRVLRRPARTIATG